jgi:hypothetical protein
MQMKRRENLSHGYLTFGESKSSGFLLAILGLSAQHPVVEFSDDLKNNKTIINQVERRINNGKPFFTHH